MNRQYFDFSSLISDFANDFTVVTRGGGKYNSSGEWEHGEETSTTYRGAIIGFRESKILRSEGTLTTKDKHLFMQQKLPEALVGSKIAYQGQEYLIQSETENAEFTGVYSYVLRWCSAIDTVQ